MNKRLALCAGAALGVGALLPSAAQAQRAGGPFADVPQTHWAYDAVQQLAQRGIFTGYPDGTFSGRRALTRYEFAVALQRMLQEVQRMIAAIPPGGTVPGPQGPRGQQGAVGPPGPPGVAPGTIQNLLQQQGLLRQDITALQRLMQEFSAELAMLGADVEQLKRNVQALADRVNRIDQTIAKMPKITGAVNMGFRVSNVNGNVERIRDAAGNLVGNRGVLGVVDRDGRLLNPSTDLLERVNAFYDIDLGITAQVSDVATARLLLNAGNYMKGYLGNRISTVNPRVDDGIEGTPGRFTVEDVIPYYLYIEAPVKIGSAGSQFTVGKFGHQFTPYTLKMVDVDSYFYNDKTDLGDYPITGARLNFRALGLNFSMYGGVHQHQYAPLSSTAGWLYPGVYDLANRSRWRPQGDALALLAPNTYASLGSTHLEQSAGVRASWVSRRLQIGATYLVGAGSSSTLTGTAGELRVSDVFRQLHVYGFDINASLFKGIGISANVTESRWDGQVDKNTQKYFGLGGNNNRRAVDLRLKIPIGPALLSGFYKNIGNGFDAPGSWGRMGTWINPRGIEGFGATAEIPVLRRLVLDAEYGNYNHNAFSRTQGYRNNADLTYLRAGLRFPLTSRNSIDAGYERVDYEGNGPVPAVDRLEQYANLGFTHQFSPNVSFRFAYQYMTVDSGTSVFSFPRRNYESNIIATQFQVRF